MSKHKQDFIDENSPAHLRELLTMRIRQVNKLYNLVDSVQLSNVKLKFKVSEASRKMEQLIRCLAPAGLPNDVLNLAIEIRNDLDKKMDDVVIPESEIIPKEGSDGK